MVVKAVETAGAGMVVGMEGVEVVKEEVTEVTEVVEVVEVREVVARTGYHGSHLACPHHTLASAG